MVFKNYDIIIHVWWSSNFPQGYKNWDIYRVLQKMPHNVSNVCSDHLGAIKRQTGVGGTPPYLMCLTSERRENKRTLSEESDRNSPTPEKVG